jgi:hypothetical protein
MIDEKFEEHLKDIELATNIKIHGQDCHVQYAFVVDPGVTIPINEELKKIIRGVYDVRFFSEPKLPLKKLAEAFHAIARQMEREIAYTEQDLAEGVTVDDVGLMGIAYGYSKVDNYDINSADTSLATARTEMLTVRKQFENTDFWRFANDILENIYRLEDMLRKDVRQRNKGQQNEQ